MTSPKIMATTSPTLDVIPIAALTVTPSAILRPNSKLSSRIPSLKKNIMVHSRMTPTWMITWVKTKERVRIALAPLVLKKRILRRPRWPLCWIHA